MNSRRRFALFLIAAAAVAPLSAGQSIPDRASLPAAAAPPQAAATMLDPERRVDALLRKERDVKKDLKALKQEAEGARARTIARGRAYVRLARAGLLPVGGGFQATVDHASKIERLHRAIARDIGLERKLAARRVALSKRLDELRQEREPLEVQARATAHARGAILAAQDRALAFQRAFESSGSAPHTAIYGGIGPSDPSEVGVGMAAMKGRLPFPLTGRAEIHSARRPGTDGPGLEMRTPRGTPVRAVYGGRVAFADIYAAYGKTVIVEHGDRHYTVSSNLDEIGVKTGDEITSGARIGSVGDSGDGPLLYFEIRAG
ncbi:MAG TPA: peptidoglycan DD-metalloendopeptidase family protein, partial [Polyangiaceae bacterium]|nr:peptidoglycan DD-metalloendopeptidase family protein [Polyangiaceae bacterium]